MEKAKFDVTVEETKTGWDVKSHMEGNGEALIMGLSSIVHDMIAESDCKNATEQIEGIEAITNRIKKNVGLMFLEDNFNKLGSAFDPKKILKDVLKEIFEDDKKDEND